MTASPTSAAASHSKPNNRSHGGHAAPSGPASPPSPFSASPTSLVRPPLARLPSSYPQRASPLVLDSLTRATLPSASISDLNVDFVELCRADGSAYSPPRPSSIALQRSTTKGHAPASTGAKGKGKASSPLEGRRTRSASIGSLQSLVERDLGGGMVFDRIRSGGSAAPRRQGSRSSSNGDALPPIEDDEGGGETTASLSQLSWGTWWPFQVVEPDKKADASASSPSDSPHTPPKKGSHEASRGFLSLFAGRQPVEDAHEERAALDKQDRAEEALLEADLEVLRRLSTSTTGAADDFAAREADDSPIKAPSLLFSRPDDKSLPPAPATETDQGRSSKGATFLPSLFSSTTTTSTAPTQATPSLPSAPKPASLLSSFTIPNPFSPTSSSSSVSLFSGATPTSPTGPRAHLARHYTTSRRPKDEEGPTVREHEVEDLVDEADRDTVKAEEQENLEVFSKLKDKYRTPKLPIVFCHGLFGFDHLGPSSIKPLHFSYWVGVQEALEAMGVEVLIGRVPASASIEERAKVLCEMIGERFPGREVNLIGHSMGGLDGRFLISRLQPTNFKVRSLTTISTPHRGSSFADFLLEDIIGTAKVPTLLSLMQSIGVPGGGKAFDDLTTTKMARFNEETPDDPSVKYFSFGAEFTPSWSNVFRVPWGVVFEREGPNDGLVSVDSSKWGEYRSTLHNVNHLDLVGWVGKVRYGWAELLGKPIKFKPISFFCAMAEMLADEGF
ncbi:hypothetical protein JCM21900_006390 [Sporobolomyces salmonicolor]